MPNTNPTIVSASLSDKELQDSINKMVANFDKGLQTMLEHSNEYVGKIQESLQKIGNTNFCAKGSNDGGVAKQTKAQNEFTDAVKKSTSEIKRQGKEGEMSFDQIAAALSKARQTVSEFNTKRASGFLPNSEDYKRYEQALARIVEYNDKLKQSALSRADANQWANAFDGKRVVSDLTAVDDRLKQLGKYYSELEKQSQKTSSSINKQLEDETGRRNIVIEQMRAYYKEQERLSKEAAKIQNKEFREQFRGALSLPANDILDAYRKIERLKALLDEMRTKKKDKIVDISEADINRVSNAITSLRSKIDKMYEQRAKAREKESAAQKIMIDDQYKLSFARTMKIPTDQLDLAQAKLERLQALLRDMRERGILSNTQIASTEAEIRKLEQIIGQVNTTQQQTTQSAQRYTEEIRKQAAAIRETQTWKEKGYAIVGGDSYYDPESSKASRKDVLSLEEQILKNTQQREEAEKKVSNVLKEEVETLNVARNGFKIDNSSKEGQGVKSIAAQKHAAEAAAKETNYLKEQVASLLDVEEREIKTANATSSSYAQLAQYLKHLQSAYQRLGADRIAKGEGTDIANEIQKTQRAMQKLQQTMSRPISLKDAMGLSEKTLDDIAYKMRQLASYRSGLNIETQTKEIDQVNRKYAQLQKTMNEIMQKNNSMIASNTALGRSWNYMKNRLAFYFTVGASTSFVKNLIDIRGQYELLERSIGILIDSAQNGSKIFAELNSMAIKSPFTTMELGAAAKQLVAYDVAAKDVVDTTKRLADMAAAVGIPIERLTYALGQIKAYGYLNARDARMFANAGIPLVRELADRYTEFEGRLVSTADVYDRIKKKAISYEDVMATVNKMTDEGGKFFNFQEKSADTLKVRIANLTLAWNNMMNEMGAANQGVLSGGLKTLSDVFKNWRSIYNLITSIIVTFGVLKATQVVVLTNMAMHIKKNITLWAALEFAMRKSIGAAVVNNLRSIGSLLARFSNPLSITAAVVTALGVAIGKAVLDYQDLIAANEAFNKSISDNAKENIDSIEKFFKDYNKQLSNVGGLNNADQEKLWERIQEEIEKTTKNAEEYINTLDDVVRTSSKIQLGVEVLEHSKIMQEELKRLADSGTFNIGGGFADDSAAKNLQQYQEALINIRQEYGSVNAAIEAHTLKSRKLMADYTTQRDEVRKELDDFVAKLDNAYLPDILGQSDDVRIQMANVRSFAESLRDAFLATEEGSKIGADGIVMLNSAIDKWVAKQGIANNLLVNSNGGFDKQRAKIEENRTAWEEFFRYVSNKDKEYLDAAIKTNNIGSEEVRKIWDNAAKEMSKRATTSYDLIQEQIAQLRETPDIVINVVYRNNKQKLEKDQEEFEKKYIQPKDWGVLSTDEYLKQEKANREKYGTLMRKQEEDTAEYEKRISDERKSQLELQKKNGDIIEENKNKTDDFSRAVTEQAKKEKQAADDRLKVIKEVEDAGGYDFSTKSERAAANKAAKQAETELQKALKDELSTIEKVRSIYKDLTKEGMSHANAVERATKGWEETVNAINKVLQKNGLKKLNLADFVGIDNPRDILKTLQAQLDALVKRGASSSEIKVLQEKIQTVSVDADKYDLTKITKGLNSELDRLKDEYELAIALDADPELGGIFEQLFDIDPSQLPRTVQEYSDMVTKALNQKLKKGEVGVELADLLGMRKEKMDEIVGSLPENSIWRDIITKAWKEIHEANKNAVTDAAKEWNKLVEKYGKLQDKLILISKDGAQARFNVIKQFGSEEEKASSKNLIDNIMKEQDPQKIAVQMEELMKRVNAIIARNPNAKVVIDATINQTSKDISKAYWEDFKESDLYTMTFEDMANNSTRAIQLIMDKLEGLKDKVKEDPASMKALIKSLEDAQKELNARDPFGGVARSLRDMANASQEAKTAQEALWRAEVDVEQAQQKVKDSEGGSPEEQKAAQDALAQAVERRANAQVKLTQAENKGKKAQENLKSSLQGISNQLGNVQELFGVVSKLFRAGGDDETADAIDAISEGFSTMTTVIMGVVAALILLEATNPWLLAIAAALSVIVGLVSFLSGNSNKKITEQVEESERAVKRLELAYIDLEHAVNEAYGMATIGANMAAKANKELQLVELKRQLALERSRDSKHRDEDKIIDLQKQIKELEYDIADTVDSIVNDLLGISSVGDAMENMMDAFIEALRSGEDAMATFDKNVDEMIANMVKKMYVTKILQPWFEEQWNKMQEQINQRAGDIPDKIAKIQSKTSIAKSADTTDNNSLVEALRALGMSDEQIHLLNWYNEFGKYDFGFGRNARLKAAYEKMLKEAEQKEAELQKELTTATMPTTDDIRQYAELLRSGQPIMEENMQEVANFLRELGLMKDDSNKNLSALQQGIQGITEDTAGALEAITNGISQQCYLQSDILIQIRDTVQSFDIDIQTASLSQILLQLQSSYQLQQSMLLTMENWTNPSGNAVRVELLS